MHEFMHIVKLKMIVLIIFCDFIFVVLVVFSVCMS